MRKKVISILLAAILLAWIPMNHVVNAERGSIEFVEKSNGENSVHIVETVDEFAQGIALVGEDDELDSDSLYATKRLIVVSEVCDFETYGAEVVSYGDMYILSYETTKKCKNAYKKLQKDETVLSVEIDAVMETEEDGTMIQAAQDVDAVAPEATETLLNQYLVSMETTKDVTVAILDTGERVIIMSS